MNPKSQSQLSLPTFGLPSPESTRTLRKFQSHQNLSFNSQLQRNNASHRDRWDEAPQHHHTQLPSALSHGRLRSNSDIVTSNNLAAPTRRRPASGRKSGAMGISGKRSDLDTLLRDGPPQGNVVVGLQELRYLILSTGVDSDIDGMVRWMPENPVRLL